MPASTTILRRVKSAIEFLNTIQNNAHWIALGGIQTPWEDENNPPILNPTLKEVPELMGCIYINTASLVTEDQTGQIYTNFDTYKAYDLNLDIDNLVSNLVFKVYCAGFIDSYIVPTGVKYRILGLINNITFKDYTPTYSIKEYVPKVNIESYDLLWINSISPDVVRANTLQQLQLIIEF